MGGDGNRAQRNVGDGRARKSRWAPGGRKQFEAAHEDGEQVEDRAAEWCTNPPSLFAKHKLVHEQQRLWFVSSTSVSLKAPDPKPRKKWGKALRHKHWRKWPQQPGVPRSQGQQTFLKGRPGMRVLNLQFHSDLVTNQQQGHITPTDSQQSGGPPAS